LLVASALHPVLPPSRHPPRRALIAAVVGHVTAAVPDLLFVLGRPHEAWMNAFVGHLTADSAPGGVVALLALFLAALAGYLVVEARVERRTISEIAEQPGSTRSGQDLR